MSKRPNLGAMARVRRILSAAIPLELDPEKDADLMAKLEEFAGTRRKRR